jgi:nucleotide-binding universal stress UspA family protein
MSAVYDNVIVPFDGSLPARAALAPAADLAWRCGARIVIVNNTEASDQKSRKALKSRAMSMSGADVDFWVDADSSIGHAVVEAARHRERSVICLPVRKKSGGLRRRATLSAVAAEVLVESPVPVLVIGPEADVSRGLPLSEIVVALDGSSASEEVLPLAIDWAQDLKLHLLLAGVVREGAGGRESHTAETAYLQGHVEAARGRVGDLGFELVEAVDPATGLCAELERHQDAIIAMSTHGRSGVDGKPLGSVSLEVMLRSPRAVLFLRPRA